MKRKVVKRVLTAMLTIAMLAGTIACSSPADDAAPMENTELSSAESEITEDDYVDDPDRTDEGYVLVWNDEFDGEELDKSKWSYQIGTGESEGLDGWGNSELEYYTDREENVRVEDGELIITAIEEEEEYNGQDFTSGRIRTYTDEGEVLFATKYGRVEARIKMPEGEGLWPAFWMLPVDDTIYKKWASSGEIDIMEARGRLPDRAGGTIHYGQNWPNNIYKGQDFVFPEDTDITDYHLYSLEWEPGILRWYVDDECYYTMDQWYSKGAACAADYTWPAPFDVPFYILLNLAVGGTFDPEGNAYSAEYPAEMKVDYVRVYQKEEGYESVSSEEVVVVENKDTAGFEQYASSYEDGEFMVDKEFATMNIEPIKDTDKGIVPESKDWHFAVGNFGGFAKASVEELEEGTFAKIDITSGGSQTYAVQLIQHMPIIEGYSYVVSFDAKASKERSFVVSPSGDGDNAWEKYGSYDAKVGTEIESYSFVFKMNSATDPTARMEFNLGNNTGAIWIGNVSVTELKAEGGIDHDMKKTPLSSGNGIYNGSFDQGNQRMAFWHTENMDVVIPDFVLTEDGTEDYSRMAQLTAIGPDAKLYQNGILLDGSTGYDLSLELSGENTADVKITITGSDGTVYSEYTINYNGSGEQEKFEHSFTVPAGVEDENAVIALSIPEGININVDNIRMYKEKN